MSKSSQLIPKENEVAMQHSLKESLYKGLRNSLSATTTTTMHNASCHAPTHARPSLPVIPKLNPAPPNLYPAELHDIAATASLWKSVKAAKDLNTTWTEHHLKQVLPPEWKDQSGLAEQFFCIIQN